MLVVSARILIADRGQFKVHSQMALYKCTFLMLQWRNLANGEKLDTLGGHIAWINCLDHSCGLP